MLWLWYSLSRGSPASGDSWKMDTGASMFCHNNWCAIKIAHQWLYVKFIAYDNTFYLPWIGIYIDNIVICSSECRFPDKLKLAEISALLKKIDRLCKENYRPVSILTALSKVFERSHSDQLSPYFGEIFSTFLSGFRKGYSCQTSLLRMIETEKILLTKEILLELSR